MIITVNIIEPESTVWITDETDPIGVELPCTSKEELKAAIGRYVDHFVYESSFHEVKNDICNR